MILEESGSNAGAALLTRGEIVFYAGVALLVVTVLLGIIFLIKKPRYIPSAYQGGPEEEARLRNAYPTVRLTKRYPHSQEMSRLQPTELVTDTGQIPDTELIQETDSIPPTEVIQDPDRLHDTSMIWGEK